MWHTPPHKKGNGAALNVYFNKKDHFNKLKTIANREGQARSI